jgi:hypothetical protein
MLIIKSYMREGVYHILYALFGSINEITGPSYESCQNELLDILTQSME